MPIDRATFIREFTLLLERFGRDPHPLMTQRYFEYLDAQLDTAAFERAARQIFEQDQFWPAPARFVDAADGDPKHQAATAWHRLVTAAHKGETPTLTPLDRTALQAVGGFREITTAADHASLDRLRRGFEDAYARAVKQQRTGAPQPALEAPGAEPSDELDLAQLFGVEDPA